MTRFIRLRALTAFAIVASMAILSGCAKPFGSVTGTVTLGGAPLSAGVVSFLAKDGTVVSANVDANGTYRVDDVPVGLARVTVYTASNLDHVAMGEVLKNQGRDPAKFKAMPKSGPPPVAVPQKYSTPETSGLTVAVGKGEMKYDIPLDK
jgi:hypothetical protein